MSPNLHQYLLARCLWNPLGSLNPWLGHSVRTLGWYAWLQGERYVQCTCDVRVSTHSGNLKQETLVPHTTIRGLPFALNHVQLIFQMLHHFVVWGNIVQCNPTNLVQVSLNRCLVKYTHTLDVNPASLRISITRFARFCPLWLPLTSWNARSKVQRDHLVRASGELCTQCTVTPRYGSRARDDQPSKVTDTSPGIL